jgi:hypothetical protein
MSVGVMSVVEITVRVMTVGVMTVEVMRRPRYYDRHLTLGMNRVQYRTNYVRNTHNPYCTLIENMITSAAKCIRLNESAELATRTSLI